MRYSYLETPIGALLIAGDDAGLRHVRFPIEDEPAAPEKGWVEDDGALARARDELAAYFAREREEFDLDLAPEGTPFQLEVWEELRRISYGETISYGELARRLGKPNAVRAVGAANGANPLPIVVPCHRVIGADGSLVGFGGGLGIKRALLDHEQGGTLFD
jgi:methylated-DNA-[protein]-cysteine S-methyltransferase